MPHFCKKPVVIEDIIYDGDKPDDDPTAITTIGDRLYVFHRNSVWAQKSSWHVRLWRWMRRMVKL